MRRTCGGGMGVCRVRALQLSLLRSQEACLLCDIMQADFGEGSGVGRDGRHETSHQLWGALVKS